MHAGLLSRVFLSFGLLTAVVPAWAEPETVTVGVFTVAPFIVADPGEAPHGLLVDFFDREVAPRMGVRFKWTPPVTVARLEQNLIVHAVQFTPILARTAVRDAAHIRFSGENYIRFEPCIAVLMSHPLNAINSTDDLAGMSIGWVQSGAMPDVLRDPRIKFDLVAAVDWERANLNKLKLGRIQGAFFSDQFTPRYYATRDGVQVKLLKLPTSGVNLYGAFAPGVPDALVNRYQRAAQAAFANGRWDAYLAKALAER